jgi:hypothetical protein
MESVRYIGVFDSEEQFDHAVKRLADLKVRIEDIYAPVPVHHAVKTLTGRSKFPTFAYFVGIVAVISILSFLYYASVVSWPLNIGGKPSLAIPSFIIVTLVLTILTVTLTSLVAFSIISRLYPGKKAMVFDARATDDKFIIVLKPDSNANIENILRENGANEVIKQV